MRQGMYLRQTMRGAILPFANMPADIDEEEVLDRSLQNIEAYTGNLTVNGERAMGNYCDTLAFNRILGDSSMRAGSDTFQLLNPKIKVESASNVSLKRDPDKRKHVIERLSRFKRDEVTKKPRVERDVFSKKFLYAYDKLCTDQDRLAMAAIEIQKEYLKTGSPFDLVSLDQNGLGKVVNLDHTVVSRRINGLSVELQDGYSILLRDLIPGQSLERRRGEFALRELMKEPEVYEHGSWKVTDANLVPILKERFNLSIARRTVVKYRNSMAEEKPKATRRQIAAIKEELERDPTLYDGGELKVSIGELESRIREKYSFLVQ